MASISTPTSLATFQAPHASSSKIKLPHVTLSPVYGTRERLAVATVQGNGVWTYDLTSLRPTSSFTVPPSTRFSTSAISFYPRRDEQKGSKAKGKQKAVDAMEVDVQGSGDYERTTVVGIEAGDGVKKGDAGKVLWVWSGEEGGAKRIITLPSAAQSLHYLPLDRFPLLAVSIDGHLLGIDNSFKQQRVSLSHNLDDIFSFGIVTTGPLRCIMVTEQGEVSVFTLAAEGDTLRAQPVMGGRLGGKENQVLFASVESSSNGDIVGIAAKTNEIYHRNIHDLSSSPTASPARLAHPPPHVVASPIPAAGRPLAIVPSHRPPGSLLLISPSAGLPAVLSSSTISSATSTGFITQLSFLGLPSSSNSTLGIVLAVPGDGEPGRSIVYLSEIALPQTGVGLNMLLGSQAEASKHLLFADSRREQLSADTSFDRLVDDIKKALKETAGSAEEVYLTWVAEQEKRHLRSPDFLPDACVRKILRTVLAAAIPSNETDDAEVLIAKMRGPYASGIVRDLISRGVVNDGMWAGGVIASGLSPCGDWNNIRLAVRSFKAIPSSTLVLLIKAVIHSPTPIHTSLQDLLRDILALPVPDPSYRTELRKGLAVEDATQVLASMVEWAEVHVEHRSEGLTDWDSEGVKHRAAQIAPSLDSVITHSSLLLDSHLPLFLSYPASHDLLRRLQEAVQPLIALQNDLNQLRGPIDAVITLAKREQRRKAEQAARRPWQRSGSSNAGDKGKRGKDQPAGMALAEEAIGKYRLEDIIF